MFKIKKVKDEVGKDLSAFKEEVDENLRKRQRIKPYWYFIAAVVLGGISGHRFILYEFKETFVRIFLMVILYYLLGRISMMAFLMVAIAEAAVSWYFCEEDKNGKISPLNIIDIMSLMAITDEE